MSPIHFHNPEPPTIATPRLVAARTYGAQGRLERRYTPVVSVLERWWERHTVAYSDHGCAEPRLRLRVKR